jgi:spore maturation protein CgeB
MNPLRIVVLGLSITSSWGNGHATNFRALVRALDGRGHDVLFLERDAPWYAAHRDLPSPPYGRTALYGSLDELYDRYATDVAQADLVVVGSYVPEGVAAGRWVQKTARGVTAFYDIDTPVTLAALRRGRCDYLSPDLVAGYDLYLSFTGGPTLDDLEHLGTYSDDRQPALDALLVEPARRLRGAAFVVAGPQYPDGTGWPRNVARIEHLPPSGHAAFYNAQRLTLNVTRADMVRAGWSPSVRLFEAAACGVAVVSDWWPGLDTFFRPGTEILVARTTEQMVSYLTRLHDEALAALGAALRARVLAEHTAEHRTDELLAHVLPLLTAAARR